MSCSYSDKNLYSALPLFVLVVTHPIQGGVSILLLASCCRNQSQVPVEWAGMAHVWLHSLFSKVQHSSLETQAICHGGFAHAHGTLFSIGSEWVLVVPLCDICSQKRYNLAWSISHAIFSMWTWRHDAREVPACCNSGSQSGAYTDVLS